jgi:hypothetical protein
MTNDLVHGNLRSEKKWSTLVIVNTYLLVYKSVINNLSIKRNNVITPLMFFNFKRFAVMNGHRVLLRTCTNSVYMYFVKKIHSLYVMLQCAKIQNNRIAGTYIAYWSGSFQIVLLNHLLHERVYDSMTARLYLEIN